VGEPDSVTLLLPVAVLPTNVDEKLVLPPEDTVPVVTRIAQSLFVVSLVQPVGGAAMKNFVIEELGIEGVILIILC